MAIDSNNVEVYLGMCWFNRNVLIYHKRLKEL